VATCQVVQIKKNRQRRTYTLTVLDHVFQKHVIAHVKVNHEQTVAKEVCELLQVAEQLHCDLGRALAEGQELVLAGEWRDGRFFRHEVSDVAIDTLEHDIVVGRREFYSFRCWCLRDDVSLLRFLPSPVLAIVHLMTNSAVSLPVVSDAGDVGVATTTASTDHASAVVVPPGAAVLLTIEDAL